MATRAEKITEFNTKQATKPVKTEVLSIPPPPPPPSTEQVIAQKATETKQVVQSQQKAEAQQNAQEEKEAQKTQDALKQAGQVAGKIGAEVNKPVDRVKEYLSSVPTPGGILSILLVVLFFVLAVTPIDKQGNTRLKLIWLTLTRKTQLDYTNNPAYGGGAGGTFGGKGGDNEGTPLATMTTGHTSDNGNIIYDVPQEISLSTFLFGEE